MFDACAMIAYLRGEEGADVIEAHLKGTEECVAHSVNLCEVYYDFVRAGGEKTAKSAIRDLEDEGLSARADLDPAFWQEVGRLKGTLGRISLADCFAVALTNRIGARVATTDHHEFDRIANEGICRVEFIR